MRILNVGCGEDTYGTDFIDKYPTRKDVKKCDVDVEKLPFKKETFDKIYSKNLLEHLSNPANFFRECNRVLKPEGTLDLTTDNASYWKNAIKGGAHLGKYEEIGLHGEEDCHFCLFTPNHIKNFFMRFSFEKIYIKYEYNAKVKTFRNLIRFLIDSFLHITPFWRCSYQSIRAMGRKIR